MSATSKIDRLIDLMESFFLLLGGTWNHLTGLLREGFGSKAVRRVKSYFAVLFYLTLSAIVLMIIGLLLRIEFIVIGSAIIASVSFLIAYAGFLLPLQICAVAAQVFTDTDRFERIKESVRSALFPVLSGSFFTASLASILASRGGFGGLDFGTVLAYSIFVLVLFVFSLFFRGNGMAAHYFVLILVVWNVIVLTWPLPTKSMMLRAETNVTNWLIGDGDISNRPTVIIPAGVQLYTRQGDGFKKEKKAEGQIEARLLDMETDYESGESLYEVILPVDNEYVGGEKYYVTLQSVRFIKNEKKRLPNVIENSDKDDITPVSSSTSSERPIAGTTETLTFKPGEKVVSSIYLYPGQRYRVVPTAPCFLTVNKIKANPHEPSIFRVVEGGAGYINVTGHKKAGTVVITVL